MNALRAGTKVLRGLLHLARAVLTVGLRFRRMAPTHRQAYVQAWSLQLLATWGIHLVVQGEPPRQGPVLMVANHISWLDIVVLHSARYCRFVSKAQVRRWPVIGSLAASAGTLFIARDSRRDALRVVHQLADVLQGGEVVAVFPEGTTGDGLQMLPFHANLLQAAVSTGVPVVPVGLTFIDAQTGRVSLAPGFAGDDTLAISLWRTLCAPPIVAVVNFGAAQQAQGRTRRDWARDLQQAVDDLRRTGSTASIDQSHQKE